MPKISTPAHDLTPAQRKQIARRQRRKEDERLRNELSWLKNPDRSGGQFSDYEIRESMERKLGRW
jgi:hypothetical protein